MRLRTGFALLILMISTATSNGQAINEGDFSLRLGHGFMTPGKILLRAFEFGADFESSGLGPYYGSFEYMVSDYVGIGVNVAHIQLSAAFTQTDLNGQEFESKFSCRNTSILANVNGHVLEDDHIDIYFSMGLGFCFGGFSYESEWEDIDIDFGRLDDPLTLPIAAIGTFGMKYMIIDNFGIYAEAGLAKSLLQIGVVSKW